MREQKSCVDVDQTEKVGACHSLHPIAVKFWRVHFTSISLLFCYVIVLGYPMTVVLINPPPEQNKLEIVSGKILDARVEHPNLKVEMSNGVVEHFEFPSNGYNLLKGFGRSIVPNRYEKEFPLLKGCVSDLKTEHLRGLLYGSRTRVWELSCNGYLIPYQVIRAEYEKNFTGVMWLGVFFHGLMLLLIALAFYAEGKKKWASH